MLTLEEITEKQAGQIACLQREIVDLKNNGDNECYRKIVSELQDTLFILHSEVCRLSSENEFIKQEKDELKKEKDYLKCENDSLRDGISRLNEGKGIIQNQYNCVINSQTWRRTQFLRDILWKLKGNK